MTRPSFRAGHLVGRLEESAALARLLDAPEQLPRVVLLSGEAGIGKTTLWLDGIDSAGERGYRILSCRPSEAETRFAFAGLADLLGNAASEVLPELPPIQRRALESALLLGESDSQADDRVVAAAFLGTLRLLARKCPVCLAVDDVQWLDAASLAALRFALARLEREQLMALLAVRGGAPAWLGRAVPEGLLTIEIGGLSVGALRELLRARLDATFPRPTLIRLWETSGGNPFFALELATALQRRGGSLAPGEQLPIPSNLDDLLRARLDRLTAPALDAARCVAALAEPTPAIVEAALNDRAEAGLTDALAAGILELEGEHLRFTHPLLGSALAARQTPSHRRSLHARLATLVANPEERARHLALATVEPDREVASMLEGAARLAHARGAPASAAELAEQALRLTPDADVADARRRLFLAADRHDSAGDTGRALALLERARTSAAPGVQRATVLARLAYIEANRGHAVELYRAALCEADGDDALEAEIHMNLASLMRFSEGAERGLEHAELAMRAAERAGDAALRCRAIAAYGLLYFSAGRGIPSAQMEAALSLERSLAEWPVPEGPTWVFGHQLWWSADVDRARALFEEVQRVATARNDPFLDARWFLSHGRRRPDKHLETTFRLRQHATFSDGTPVTADDVIFSWKLSLNPAWPAQAGNDLESKYSDVVAVDPHTVVFKLKAAVVHPLYLYGLPDVWIYPSRRIGSLVDFDPQNSAKVANLQSSVYARQPVGSGPYILDSWDPGIQMVLHARSDYYRGKPPIDTIVLRGFGASKETLLGELQAGDIQIIGDSVDVSDVDTISAIPGVSAYVRAGTTVEHIDFNLQNPILADKQVRRAIAYAIDRQDLVNRVLANQSTVADSWVPRISEFFNPNTPKYAFNPDQARAILEADGWSPGADGIRVNTQGQRLSFKYQSTRIEARNKTMPLIKDELAAVGIEVNIDQLPGLALFGKNGPLVQGTFDLAEYADIGTQDAGADVATKFGSKFIPNQANNFSGSNLSRYSNATVDQLISAEIGTLVPGVRQSSMNALQVLLADDLPTLPLYFRPNVTAASNKLVNWKPEYNSNGYTWNAWEWDMR